jgi:proline iminopeptidase
MNRFAPLCLTAIAVALLFARPAAAHEERGKTFETPDATIYYEVTGTGTAPPRVVVNGGPGFDHTYLHLTTAWDAVGLRRPVIYYDQRGNGRSLGNHPKQAQNLKAEVDDLEALRVHLKLERMDLLGHSWGGYLVMAYAALHPDRIAHLVIMDSAAPRIKDTLFRFDDFYPDIVERQNAFAFADEIGDPAATAAGMHEYFGMLFYSTEKRDAFLAGIAPGAYTKTVNAAVSADLERYDLNPELPKFRFPTLVITGRFDINVAPAVAFRIHKAIPGSQLRVFERSGHMPFVEQPEEFVATLEQFLAH